MAVRFPCICLVTDRLRLTDPTDDELVRLASSAGAAGVDLIQIRERGRDDRDLLALARRIVRVVAATAARVVMNDRTDIALAAAAAGVQLRGDSPDSDRVRAIVPPGFLIGRSVHDAEQAIRAAGSGADYVIMGTIYPTRSKDPGQPVAGIDGVKEVSRAVSIPVLAIGGITTDKVGALAAAGASGIAAIGLFTDAFNENRKDDPVAALERIVGTIRAAFMGTP